MRLRRLRSRTSRRGAAAVEFAILAPLLCFALVATIDFARVFYFSVTVNNCARNGALYACADAARSTDSAGIAAAARQDAANLDSSQLQVTSSTEAGSSVSVQVRYPFRTIASYPGIPALTTLSRTVRMNIVPATPTFN